VNKALVTYRKIFLAYPIQKLKERSAEISKRKNIFVADNKQFKAIK
jgi:hypothetical protein